MDEEGLGRVIALVRSDWRRLVPVIIATFAVNFVLTFTLVEVASPVVNLDSMLPFYEILQNSTALAVAGDEPDGDTESSPFLKLHRTGEFFWSLSMAVAMFLFSQVCHLQEPGGAGHRTWRQRLNIFCSMALAILLWQFVGSVIMVILQMIDKESFLREIDALLGCGYLLIAVVVSRENIYGHRAIMRAYRLVLRRRTEVSAMSLVFLLVLNGLGELMTSFYLDLPRKESPPTIREDTFNDISRFSLVAALVDVIMQSFVCLRILVFYRDNNGPNNAAVVEGEGAAAQQQLPVPEQPQGANPANIQALMQMVQEGFTAQEHRFDELQAIIEGLHIEH